MTATAQTINLQLDIFEGPLDLLLYLIKKNDLEISRVSLASVTDQYLQYLSTFDELDIDIASEFLLIAAELAHIKSKSLLPSLAAEEGVEDNESGGGDLLSRLREYQQIKQAAGFLAARPWLGRDVFKRGDFTSAHEIDDEPKSESFDVTAYDLIAAFAAMLNRLPKEKREHHVMAERISVTERIYEILETLKLADSTLFEDLFPTEAQRIDYVVTFLAVLEMARLKMIRVFQGGTFESIRLQRSMELIDSNGVLSEAKDDFR